MAAKKKSTAKRKPVPRHTRKYQFRDEHPMDNHVENVLNYWKHGKQEITNLRKAVALYYALEQGNLSELFDFFPQYKAQFAPDTAGAIEQFMDILRKQSANNGAGQSHQLPANPPPKSLAPVVKQSVSSVSADD
ncbi:MAG: hypothetical protein ABI970_26830, partial [Chloroflexota bacterium]